MKQADQREVSRRGSLAVGVAALLWLASWGLGCGEKPVSMESVKQALGAQEIEAVDWRAEVNELYRSAKAAGEDVPDDISDWVAEDFGRIGGWEYATVSVSAADVESLQITLDAKGQERWECFHVIERGDEMVLMFKRKMRSYLGAIPLRELVRLVTLSPGIGSEP